MRRKRNFRTEEAWEFCHICGLEFPMSELVVSNSRRTKGHFVCAETCVDSLDVERREREISRVLQQGAQYEGTDTRHTRRRFFGSEEI